MTNSIFDTISQLDAARPYKMDDYVCDVSNILPPGQSQVFLDFGNYKFGINELTTYEDIHNHMKAMIENEYMHGHLSNAYNLASIFEISNSEVNQIEEDIRNKLGVTVQEYTR